MKFAKQYTEAYRELPPSWPAFQYKALKKSIGKIVEELKEKGIVVQDDDHQSGEASTRTTRHCTVDYFLEGSHGNLEPFIVINLIDDAEEDTQIAGQQETTKQLNEAHESAPPFLHFTNEEDGLDIEVGPASRRGSAALRIKITSKSSASLKSLFKSHGCLMQDQQGPSLKIEEMPMPSDSPQSIPSIILPYDESDIPAAGPSIEDVGEVPGPSTVSPSAPTFTSSHLEPPPSARRRLSIDTSAFTNIGTTTLTLDSASDTTNNIIKLFLKTDHQFFAELATAINAIAQFEDTLKRMFSDNLDTLSTYLAAASSPYNKDMYAWRKLLAAYLESEIWLVNGVKDRPLPSSREQLNAFDMTVRKSLKPSLRSSTSAAALESFLQMNREMLAMKQFDEINQTAVRKILKKHDKRTQLTASTGFTRFLHEQSFFVDNVARALIFTIQERLVTIIPQPDDYSCPICQDIYWKPIRLACGHVFCVRCLVKAQARRVKNCPICRAENAVENATADQLDTARMNMIKLYFPKEVKKKARDNGRERAEEDMRAMFGHDFVGPSSPGIPSITYGTQPVRSSGENVNACSIL